LNTHIKKGKLGPGCWPRRHPLILRFFPIKRVSALIRERNLHLVISFPQNLETQPLDFLENPSVADLVCPAKRGLSSYSVVEDVYTIVQYL